MNVRFLMALACAGMVILPTYVSAKDCPSDMDSCNEVRHETSRDSDSLIIPRKRETITVYRNAGDYVIDRVADKVIDKVFGEEHQHSERDFSASVSRSIWSDGSFPLRNVHKVVIKSEMPSGYRADSYSGGIMLDSETAQRLHNLGIEAVTYEIAVERYGEPSVSREFPVTLTVGLKDCNKNSVSMGFSMTDNNRNAEFFNYNGFVSASEMSDTEKDKAIVAIIDDFIRCFNEM